MMAAFGPLLAYRNLLPFPQATFLDQATVFLDEDGLHRTERQTGLLGQFLLRDRSRGVVVKERLNRLELLPLRRRSFGVYGRTASRRESVPLAPKLLLGRDPRCRITLKRRHKT